MSRADTSIRLATYGVVVAVAAFAGIVSYSHLYDLGTSHGEAGTAARLLPLSVDLLIVAASLVLLHEARNGRRAPALAQLCLGLGVAATVAGNVLFGVRYGPVGALVSAWPAASFIGSAELLMVLVRKSRVRTPMHQVLPGTPERTATSNGHDPEVQHFREYLERGEIPGIRTINSELQVGQDRAQQVRDSIRQVVSAP